MQARALNAIPFDVPEVEYSHYEDRCTFDYFLQKHALTDPALQAMAPIVRGADTDNHSVAAQIFKKLMGQNPSDYRKIGRKGKAHTKG